jgi:hypothetical protein
VAAFAVAGMVLAQLAGCGGCVKEDEPAQQSNPAASGGRKPIDIRAADKRLSQFTTPDGAADASTD